MVLLTNAFSINMLTGDSNISFAKITLDQAKEILQNGFTSAIGHQETANVVGDMLGLDTPCIRSTITMEDATIIVAQYTGPRLPEGSTTLPENATITFWKVEKSNAEYYKKLHLINEKLGLQTGY